MPDSFEDLDDDALTALALRARGPGEDVNVFVVKTPLIVLGVWSSEAEAEDHAGRARALGGEWLGVDVQVFALDSRNVYPIPMRTSGSPRRAGTFARCPTPKMRRHK